jgi:hypothetical protein
MGPRAFKFTIAAITALVLLSTLAFPGALIGFICGIAVAFFLAPATFLLQGALNWAGLPMSPTPIFYALAALYGLGVLVVLNRARLHRAAGHPDGARAETARGLFLAVLPLVAWLSGQALTLAWP